MTVGLFSRIYTITGLAQQKIGFNIMDYNFFEVLELSIDDIQDKDEATIKKRVNDAHTKLYALTIGAYANVPRSDGLTQAQWQKVLNDAKATLLDPRKRQKHIADLMPEPESTQAPETTKIPEPESTQAPETTKIPEPESTQAPESIWGKWIALSTVHLLIAILLWWTWVYHVKIELTGDFIGDIAFFLLTLLCAILVLGAILAFIAADMYFPLGVVLILAIPPVYFIETFLFELPVFGFPYVSLFFNPFFIVLDFLKTRFPVGFFAFFKYCRDVLFDIYSDYDPLRSIKFFWDCLCYVRYRYRSLIAILAGTLAGGLAFYGGRTDFFSELFKVGFVSSVTSIDFVFFDFLGDCLMGFVIVVTFVRGVFYRRLGLMIKRLIMIGIVILTIPLSVDLSEIFIPYNKYIKRNEMFLTLLPAALIIIFYYTVGYIRYTRNLTK